MKKLRVSFLSIVLWPALLFLLLTPIALRAASPSVPSSPPDRVVDLADIIKPDLERELVSALHDLEKKTTAQMAILTVTSLNGQDIESFSLHVAEQWQLGQKGKDNGLLLTVALKDRKYRFETGYGMESILPDSLLGNIGRKNLVPFFKQGKYDQGIAAATQAVLTVLAKHYNVQLGGVKKPPESKPSLLYSIGCKIVMWLAILAFIGIILTVIILAIFNKDKRSCSCRSSNNDSWSSSSASSSWSSDSSSSSDSDFSGGGGDFGGGGASGDW